MQFVSHRFFTTIILNTIGNLSTTIPRKVTLSFFARAWDFPTSSRLRSGRSKNTCRARGWTAVQYWSQLVSEKNPKIAIVDHGLGNLYSVKHACMHVGLDATITSSKSDILNADAVILPGVGAFGDAMATLHRLDLVSVLREIAASSKPLIGICLGVQL